MTMKFSKLVLYKKETTPNKSKRRYLIIITVLILIPLCYIRYSKTEPFFGSLLDKRGKKSLRPITCDCDNSKKIPCKINGIRLHFKYDPKIFFSSESMKQCNGQQFDLYYVQEIILKIKEFISKYNSDFLKSNLTDIFILKNFEYKGKLVGGAYCYSWIYISYDPNYYVEQPIQGMLHSELSSILMRNYPFPEQEWLLINNEKFIYKKNILEVLGKTETNRVLPDSLEAGFITEYAKTSLENDFNMIVMVLFSQETELCELRNRYKRINKKAELVINFYKSIGSGVDFLECKR